MWHNAIFARILADVTFTPCFRDLVLPGGSRDFLCYVLGPSGRFRGGSV